MVLWTIDKKPYDVEPGYVRSYFSRFFKVGSVSIGLRKANVFWEQYE